MKKTFIMALLFACLGSVPVFAAPYVSVSAGRGIPGDLKYVSVLDKLDNSVALNVAAGYNFWSERLKNFGSESFGSERLEIAVGNQRYDYHNFTHLHLSAKTVMVNGYHDFDDFEVCLGIKTYVMAGAGIADLTTNDNLIDGTFFSWQVGAGGGVKLTKSMTFDLGYRYLKPVGVEDVYGDKVSWKLHNILAGIRYEF